MSCNFSELHLTSTQDKQAGAVLRSFPVWFYLILRTPWLGSIIIPGLYTGTLGSKEEIAIPEATHWEGAELGVNLDMVLHPSPFLLYHRCLMFMWEIVQLPFHLVRAPCCATGTFKGSEEEGLAPPETRIYYEVKQLWQCGTDPWERTETPRIRATHVGDFGKWQRVMCPSPWGKGQCNEWDWTRLLHNIHKGRLYPDQGLKFQEYNLKTLSRKHRVLSFRVWGRGRLLK